MKRCFFLFIILVVIYSCKENDTVDDSLVFRYNENGNILSLDPAFARLQSGVWASRQIFTPLVRLNDNTQIEPELAKYWEISSDGLRYKFILRNDVYFHKSPVFLPQHNDSTRSVTSHDFKYSLSRLIDPNIASPGSWIMNQVKEIIAENDTTLIIKLKEPFPAFIGLLAMPYAMAVPKEAVEKLGKKFRTEPIGSGAFYVKYWKEGEKLILRKNPNFFDKDSCGNSLPYLEAINISFLPDKQAAFMEFLLGNFDFVSGLDPGYTDEILTAEGKLREKFKDRVELRLSPYFNTEYLGIKMNLPKEHPLSDIRIRKALNYSFDREAMMLYLRKNIGTAANGNFIPKGLGGSLSDRNYNLYQPELAKKLIDDYVKEKGRITPFVLQVNASYQDLCEFIQSRWQSIGIPVKVEVVQLSSLRQAMATGKIDFFRASWVCDYPDAENYMSLFYSKNHSPDGPNYTHYTNHNFDRLYEIAIQQTDNKLREKMYSRLDSMVMEDAAVIVLFYDEVTRFQNPKLRNFNSNMLNHIDLRAVYKEK